LNRRDQTARTAIQELITSGVVVPFAPSALEAEVSEHLPALSIRWAVPASDLQASWNSYRSLIKWVEPRSVPALGATCDHDPDDRPYVELAQQLGAAGVVTKDRHYDDFPVKAIDHETIRRLRVYARHTATRLSIELSGCASSIVMGALVRAIAIGIGKLPNTIKLALAGGAIAALLHEPTRKKLQPTASTIGRTCIELLASLASVLADARKVQSDSLEQLEAASVRDTQPRALADHAVLACVHVAKPLTLEALVAAVSRSGYATRAKDLRPYLGQVLRRDGRFVRTRDRRWMLNAALAL